MDPTKDPAPNLMRGSAESMDRVVERQLEQLKHETKLGRSDDALAQLDALALEPMIEPAEITGSSNELGIEDIDVMLTAQYSGEAKLADKLMREAFGGGGRFRKIIQTGMTLFKHKRYKESAELWELQRKALGPSDARMDLLLLLLEAWTARQMNDVARAERLAALAAAHPQLKSG